MIDQAEIEILKVIRRRHELIDLMAQHPVQTAHTVNPCPRCHWWPSEECRGGFPDCPQKENAS
jgi:hypothetical protein